MCISVLFTVVEGEGFDCDYMSIHVVSVFAAVMGIATAYRILRRWVLLRWGGLLHLLHRLGRRGERGQLRQRAFGCGIIGHFGRGGV